MRFKHLRHLFRGLGDGCRYGTEVLLKQYTLGTLLLLTSCMGLACAYCTLWYQHRVALRELELLRTEQGILSGIDRNEVSIVAVPTNELDVWRWRIFVPQGSRVDIGIETKDIPASGTPKPLITGAFIESNPNGTLITGSIKKSVKKGYDLILNLGNGILSNVMEDRDLELWHDGGGESMVAGLDGTQSVALGESIILVRKRLMEPVSATQNQVPSGLSRGYMLWIRPHKWP